jgi:hypothetical protein
MYFLAEDEIHDNFYFGDDDDTAGGAALAGMSECAVVEWGYVSMQYK